MLWGVRVPHVGTHDNIADTNIVVSSVLRLHTRGVKCKRTAEGIFSGIDRAVVPPSPGAAVGYHAGSLDAALWEGRGERGCSSD